MKLCIRTVSAQITHMANDVNTKNRANIYRVRTMANVLGEAYVAVQMVGEVSIAKLVDRKIQTFLNSKRNNSNFTFQPQRNIRHQAFVVTATW